MSKIALLYNCATEIKMPFYYLGRIIFLYNCAIVIQMHF